MGIIQYMVEVYSGHNLTDRQVKIAPLIMAVQESMQICLEFAQYQQPLKIVFIRDDGEKLEFKNLSYLEMEKPRNIRRKEAGQCMVFISYYILLKTKTLEMATY